MTMKIFFLICACTFLIIEAKGYNTAQICDSSFNAETKVQCYCVPDATTRTYIRSADCFLTKPGVIPDDSAWEPFEAIQNITKLSFSSTRGIALNFIPSNALKYLRSLVKLEVKYGHIQTIQEYSFSSWTKIEELSLKDNQIKALERNAIANNKRLMVINLEQNNIEEINRDVFVNLPALEKLFLTNNKISTIHDGAFQHLTNLREIEINNNKLFTMNSDTFSGLINLRRLDLTNNSLEVIGDNTFISLSNLSALDLASNEIQMLDDHAFAGLAKLRTLSLAHNKLEKLHSKFVFQNLSELSYLSLKSNNMVELKHGVIVPIIQNLYEPNSNFDVEDNQFPCSCNLDWFLRLMNRTENKNMKIALENLKCVPDASLKELYAMVVSGTPVEEDPQTSDYEYYDDTQLNGMLFYLDVRDLINCTGNPLNILPLANDNKGSSSKTTRMITPNQHAPIPNVINHGTLDLAQFETATTESMKRGKTNKIIPELKQADMSAKIDQTTTRLGTVSAKPIDNKLYENMASDEAKPDKMKFHGRSTEIKEPKIARENAANRSLGCVLTLVMLCVKLLY